MVGLLKNPRTRSLLIGLAVAVVLVGGLSLLRRGDDRETLTLDEFQVAVQDGEVATAELKDKDNEVLGELEDGSKYQVAYPVEFGDELTTALTEADPPIELEVDQQQESLWVSLLYSLLPMVLLIGVFLYFISSMQGGKGAMKFGRAKARKFDKDQPQVTFADVAGSDEALHD